MKWTEDDIRFLNENFTIFGSLYCSKQLNRSIGATRKKAYSLKIKSFKYHKPIYNIKSICVKCGENFIFKSKNKNEIKKYCNRNCANSRTHSEKTINKISKSLTKKPYKHKCNWCDILFESKKIEQSYCSRKCVGKYRASLVKNRIYVKRSKNEIYFAELCEKRFNNIECNKPIFNGWDADVIIHDLKIAVLWNGKWHYEKITKKHSVKQVQNRDKIKLNEIKKYGYEPYIIKDMGKHNKDFVKIEFEIFKKYIS